MTIGQLKETILSTLVCMYGPSVCIDKDLHCSAFSNADQTVLSSVLKQNEMHPSCRVPLYGGIDACRYAEYFFIAFVHCQRLKHMVQDKFHSRRIGPVAPLTRQPLAGRARNGGLRIGEMERDAMISHGAVQVLRDRLLWQADAFRMVICKVCGIFVYPVFSQCSLCHGHDMRAVTVPYTFKLLLYEILAMGVVGRIDPLIEVQ